MYVFRPDPADRWRTESVQSISGCPLLNQHTAKKGCKALKRNLKNHPFPFRENYTKPPPPPPQNNMHVLTIIASVLAASVSVGARPASSTCASDQTHLCCDELQGPGDGDGNDSHPSEGMAGLNCNQPFFYDAV